MTNQDYKKFESLMGKPANRDGKQCECLHQRYRPFILGGDTYPIKQCQNKASYKIISHAEHEKDMPPMFICKDCITLFKKDNKNLSDYEIVRIKVKKNDP